MISAIKERLAWGMLKKYGITKDIVEQKKAEFLGWLAERGKIPHWSDFSAFARDWNAFLMDTKGETNIVDWIIGIIIAAILGVGVALPIVIDTVNNVMPNVSGITATVIGVIPVAVAITLLLVFLGR